MKLFKVLKNGKAKDGGRFDYSKYIKSKKWLPIIRDLEKCSKGYHLTNDYTKYLDNANQVFEVEIRKGIKAEFGNDDKIVVSTFRFKCLIETNTGKSNTGLCNSGDCNSGYCNSGYCNSGYCNSGYCNSGNCNSGDRNSGYCNSGNCNSGDRNSGDWNNCNCETGCFNTEKSDTIRVFNKECKRIIWEKAEKPNFLFFDLTTWVEWTEEEEKKQNKNRILTQGRLITTDYKTAFKNSFNKTSKEDVLLLLRLPNFSSKVFLEISGITKEQIENKVGYKIDI